MPDIDTVGVIFEAGISRAGALIPRWSTGSIRTARQSAMTSRPDATWRRATGWCAIAFPTGRSLSLFSAVTEPALRARAVAGREIPIFAVNLGGLGFSDRDHAG